MFGSERKAGSEQNLQRDKDEQDHTTEMGLAVMTRRNLRALAATVPRMPLG
jgi:hypothetical protein